MISPSVKRFLGFGALLFGVGLSVWGVGYIRNAFASKEWPTTNGVVDWAEVSVSERGRDKDTYTSRGFDRVFGVDDRDAVASDGIRVGQGLVPCLAASRR